MTAVMYGKSRVTARSTSLPRFKTAGFILREERELKGISQESAASHLNLMTSHIVAMESDAYNPHLEGRHFADYIKSYAEFLDLNPLVLMDIYNVNADEKSAAALAERPSPRLTYGDLQQQADEELELGNGGQGLLAGGSGAAFRALMVLGLLCIAWLATYQSRPSSESFLSRVQSAVSSSITERSATADVVEVSERKNWTKPAWTDPSATDVITDAQQQIDTGLTSNALTNSALTNKRNASANVAALNESIELGSADLSPASPQETQLTQEERTSAELQPASESIDLAKISAEVQSLDPVSLDSTKDLTDVVAGAGEDVLVFSFHANCWVEVYDSQQNPMVMDTKLSGETLRISGTGPFEVRVGNSRAVSLTMNGQTVPIDKHPTIDSTELIVGSR